jgi:hypothetical protein
MKKFKFNKYFILLGIIVLVLGFLLVPSPVGNTIVGDGDEWSVLGSLMPFAVTSDDWLSNYSSSESILYNVSGYQKELRGTLIRNSDGARIVAITRISRNPVLEDASHYYVKGAGVRAYTATNSRLYYSDKCYSNWGAFWYDAQCINLGCFGLQQVGSGQFVEHRKNLLSKTSVGVYSGCPTYVYFTNSSLGDSAMWIATADGVTSRIDLRIDCLASDSKCVGTTYYSCSNGSWLTVPNSSQCGYVAPQCSGSQEKCEGTNYFVCSGGQWSPQGQVDGKCDYITPQCSAGEQSCEGSTLKYCSGGQWAFEQNSAQCVTPDCSGSQQECDGTTLKTCVGGKWNYEQNSAQCGYVPPTFCVNNELKCEGNAVMVCKNNAWDYIGLVPGQCGVPEPSLFEDPLILGLIALIVFGGLGVGFIIILKKKKRRR